jgi:predicted phage terminase large subunit-like protein
MLRDATCRTFTELARKRRCLVRPIGGEAFSATIAVGDGTAEVLFRSTDNPDRLRGPSLSGVWMDEASFSDHEAFQICSARLREASEAGWLSLTFTPKGRLHWTYSEVFGKPGRTDVTLVTADMRENPFLSEDLIRNVEANYSGLLAAQELGGQFVTVEGAEWPPEYFPDSMWFDDWPASGVTIKVIGVDPSKGKDAKSGDYCAITMLARTQDGTLWCEGDLFRRPSEFIVEQTYEHWKRFGGDVVAVEANQFQELLALQMITHAKLRGMPMPINTIVNNVNKQVRIRRLGPYLKTGVFRFRDTPGTRLLVEQLRAFPEYEHDDGPDSLELTLRAMIESWNGRHARRATR